MHDWCRTTAVSFILAGLCLGLVGCGGATAASPTPSAEDVIRTAEAMAEATRSAATPTPSPAPIPPTPTAPLVTDTPVPSPTSSVPIVMADYNANVRSGPDESYSVIDVFLQGQTAEVVATNNNLSSGPSGGTWYLLRRIGGGLDGWVFFGAVTLSGDLSGVPYQDVPTPTGN
jgi:uncharacterized protein YgiM (DUF1202 family)